MDCVLGAIINKTRHPFSNKEIFQDKTALVGVAYWCVYDNDLLTKQVYMIKILRSNGF